ncbi:MAG: hypothetical protein JNN15_21565, partial [Blastocatellia bacterium]|nr:hypothetical protein [Blastocatellia bacterium]
QMARENPGIDVIIGANEMHLPVPAMREGNTVICYAWHQTKSIGELRLYIDSQGKVKDYLNRYISLDKAVPDQVEALKIVEASKKDIQEAQKRIADRFDVAGKTVPTILSTGQPKKPTN